MVLIDAANALCDASMTGFEITFVEAGTAVK